MSELTQAILETTKATGQPKAVRREWAKRLFATIDRQDADAFLAFLTADARFIFGNLPTMSGHAAIRGFFSAPAPYLATRHSVVAVWEEGGAVIVEASVEYTRHDNTTITLPGAAIFRLEGALIRDYRVFTDISPLFA